MQNSFYEESSTINRKGFEKRKYIFLNVISWLIFASIIIFIGLLIFSYDVKMFTSGFIYILLYSIIPAVILIGMYILVNKLKSKSNVEFDYTIAGGYLSISKAINNKKYYFVTEFMLSDISLFGKCNSNKFLDLKKDKEIKKMILTVNKTPADDKDFYYFIVNIKGIKTLLMIECTQNFLIYAIRNGARNISFKDI